MNGKGAHGETKVAAHNRKDVLFSWGRALLEDRVPKKKRVNPLQDSLKGRQFSSLRKRMSAEKGKMGAFCH